MVMKKRTEMGRDKTLADGAILPAACPANLTALIIKLLKT
jgi:hypothetical protein